MKLQRFVLLGLIAATVSACSNDDTGPTVTNFAPAAAVRFVHAAPDTGVLEIRWTDQLSGSPYYGQFNFRTVTAYQAVEVANGTRTFRAFPAMNNDISVVTQVIFDGTLNLTANEYYTVLLHGPARDGQTGITVLQDSPRPTPATGQLAFRVVNTSAVARDVHAVDDVSSTLSGGTVAFANVAPRTQTPYVTRSIGPLAVRVTAPSATSPVAASVAAPAGAPPASSSQTARAGATISGSLLSAFIFPPSVTGSGAPSVTTTGVVWAEDNRP
jgi:hypothetical protein